MLFGHSLFKLLLAELGWVWKKRYSHIEAAP